MWWRVLSVVLAFGLITTLAWPGRLARPPVIETSRAVVGLAAAVSPVGDSPVIAETTQRPVAIATLPCKSSLQSTSSGFVIDDELVVTVAHAIYEARDFAVRDSTGRWHGARVQHMDLERDLAVLRVPGLSATEMELRPASSGEPVRVLEGAASGTATGEILRRVRITTEVIGDRSRESARSGYELTVEIKGGDSGSAVVDADGALLGVVFARSTRREASWATSATEMIDLTEARTVPEWRCERDSPAELVLEPLDPLAPAPEPTRLAN